MSLEVSSESSKRESLKQQLLEKIASRTARIGIIGLGYVGLPLAIAFARRGFRVTGFDIDPGKVEQLSRGETYIKHIPAETIREVSKQSGFSPTANFGALRDMDCILICVPTPLSKNREPDLSYVLSTTREVARHLRPGQLIVLESTTYPGTTDDDMRPILESTGMKAGSDFFLAYSPEREDPSNAEHGISTTPKVVGGYAPDCTAVAKALYECVTERVVPVSSTRVAEAAKLLENIYRAVNIALVNELKMLFERMGIDVYEVIEAAKTKPFGFQAFYPGPGLGGHCIPIDPFYLTWKAREYDFQTRFIELAGEINTRMPYYVVEKTAQALSGRGKALKGARVLILGVAYKKDVDDIRESPSLKLMEIFRSRGANVDYSDPYVPKLPKMRSYDFQMVSVPLDEDRLAGYDCVLIATDHSSFDYEFIVKASFLVVDTRNATKGISGGNVVRA